MNRNKKITKTMAMAMTGIMIANAGMCGVYAADTSADEVNKEETVFVKMDPSGETQEVIVSDWLKNTHGSSTLTDKTNLTNIENVKGDETFSQNGDEITWNADGNDIYYQGNTDKALPVNMKMQYFLDGKEVTPEELGGKSGHVKIVYSFENLSKVGDVYTPFTMVTGMILKPENFKNVTVKNGRLISDGEKNIVIGIALPGLKDSLKMDEIEALDDYDIDIDIPDSFEIEADATDFKLDMSMTVALPLNLSELDLSDIEDTDDLKDKIQELKDGATDLVDGAGELNDGVKTLKDSCVDLVDGMNQVNDGTGELKDGIGTLNTKKKDLVDGAKQLADGLNTLNKKKATLVKGANDLNTGAQKLDAGAGTLKEGLDTLAAGLGSLDSQRPALINGLNALIAGVAKLESKDVKTALITGAKGLDAGLNTLKTEGIDPLAAGSSQVTGGLTALNADGEGTVKGGLKDLLAGLDSENSKDLKTLLEGLTSYVNGVKQLEAALAEKDKDGNPGYLEGTQAVVDGLKEANSSLDLIIAGMEAQMGIPSQTQQQTPAETPETEEGADVAPTSSEETQTKTVDVSVEVSFADVNADAIASLQNSIAGDEAVLQSLYDVRSKKSGVSGELLKTYSNAYNTYSAQLDNCIAQMESDIAQQKATLAALQQKQTVQTTQDVEVETADLTAVSDQTDGQGTGTTAPAGDAGQMATLYTSLKKLQQGMHQLTGSAQGLVAVMTDKEGNEMLDKDGNPITVNQYLRDSLQELNKSSDILLGGVNSLINKVKTGVGAIYVGMYGDGTPENPGGIPSLLAGSQQVSGGLQQIQGKMNDEVLPGSAALSAGISSLYSTGIDVMYTKLKELGKKLPGLDSGINQLAKGATALDNGAGDLKAGTKELAAGTQTLKNGAGDLSTGVQKLADGGNKLNSGVGTLSDGVQKLADGSSELKDGTQKLADGGVDLSEGVDELYDGSTQLKDGVDQLDEEVLQKLIKFADEDLEDMIDRLKDLKDAGEAYQWFSDGSIDSNGTVKFVIETTSIE